MKTDPPRPSFFHGMKRMLLPANQTNTFPPRVNLAALLAIGQGVGVLSSSRQGMYGLDIAYVCMCLAVCYHAIHVL